MERQKVISDLSALYYCKQITRAPIPLFLGCRMGSTCLTLIPQPLFPMQPVLQAHGLSYQFCILHPIMAWDDVTLGSLLLTSATRPTTLHNSHVFTSRHSLCLQDSGERWPWLTLSPPASSSGNEGRKEFLKLLVGFSLSEFPHTRHLAIERKNKLVQQAMSF